MRREFKPWFAVVNEDYNQGSSGGGVIPGPDSYEPLCGDEDGIMYMYFSDRDEAEVNGVSNYQGVGWYKCNEDGDFDPSYYSASTPSGAHSC